VGNTPTRATIYSYKERFGDDYFRFWVGGVRPCGCSVSVDQVCTRFCRDEWPPDCTTPISLLQVCCLVLNASLFADPSKALEEYEEQRAWFVQELQAFSRGTPTSAVPSRPT
jgi:hypothetical protein